MIRSIFIQRKVLELYKRMDAVSYPIQPEQIIQYIPKDCRILSYQEMAKATGCTVQDIAVLCKSNSGATHYDPDTNRYLILYNSEMNSGRIRWTLAHEIGHICIGHLEVIEDAEIAYTESRGYYDQFESEADYFAWNLLAPLPIMREMGIHSPSEIKSVYGLSNQATALQYDRYTKWCRSHIKTAWENELIRTFRSKHVT